MTKGMEKRRCAARWAAAVVFFVNGALFGTWVPQIPLIKARLGLDDGELGLALLCLAGGAVAGFLFTGYLIDRFGSRAITSLSLIAMAVFLPLPVLAPTPLMLSLYLSAFGAAGGIMDVSMNAQAVKVEKAYARPLMSSFHGMFSLGGLAGAGIGGLFLSAGAAPARLVPASALFLLLLGAAVLPRLLPFRPASGVGCPTESGKRVLIALPSRPVLGLSVLAFFTLACEGAMADWSAVYLRDALLMSPGSAAAGYAAFSTAMAAGRLAGDPATARLGPILTIRAGAAMAALGLALALGPGSPPLALAGFGCVGLGLANIIPVLFSAAGRTPGLSPGTAIAAVCTMGYFGFLVGPPVIGFLADRTTLSASLWLLAGCMALTALLAGAVRRETPAKRTDR